MRKKWNIQFNNATISIIALTLLLFISPCKVRNFIQAEIGVLQTEVANKSQTTLNKTNCVELELAITSVKSNNDFLKYTSLPIAGIELPFRHFTSITNYNSTYTNRNHSGSNVPLYILYQNFKNYL